MTSVSLFGNVAPRSSCSNLHRAFPGGSGAHPHAATLRAHQVQPPCPAPVLSNSVVHCWAASSAGWWCQTCSAGAGQQDCRLRDHCLRVLIPNYLTPFSHNIVNLLPSCSTFLAIFYPGCCIASYPWSPETLVSVKVSHAYWVSELLWSLFVPFMVYQVAASCSSPAGVGE